MLSAGHDKPHSKSELALDDLVLFILAYFVLATGTVVGRDLCEES